MPITTKQSRRNPKWHRDELILALDLYFNLKGSITSTNPEIIELSKTLNKLPIFKEKPDEEKFRNPNGASMKLSNFLAVDPNYHGRGLNRGGNLEKVIFEEFQDNREELGRFANTIRQAVEIPDLALKLYEIHEEVEEEKLEFREGKTLYKLHKYKERNSKLVLAKKTQHLKKYGALDCEACTFNFQVKYGDLGMGFIECHHQVPLNQYDGVQETKLSDLVLVCSNCHRMLHRSMDMLNIELLKSIIN